MTIQQQKINEGNDKIAKFLGWYQIDKQLGSWYENQEFAAYVVYSIHNNYPHQDLPFHRDWNYMMKVITKLEDMGACIHSANYCKDVNVKNELAMHVGFGMTEDYYCDISGSIKENGVTRYYQIQTLDIDRLQSLWNTVLMFVDFYNDKSIRILNVVNGEVVRKEKA
jgi:hypothetical protein